MKTAALMASAAAALGSVLPSLTPIDLIGVGDFPILAEVNIDEITTEIANLTSASQTLWDKSISEDRELSDDELKTIKDNGDRVAMLNRRLEAAKAMSNGRTADPGAGRRTNPNAGNQNGNQPQNGGQRVVPATARDTRKGGYNNFGEFALAVHKASVNPQNTDPRLTEIRNATLSTGGTESNGADGGWTVPPEFSTEIMKKVEDSENLMMRAEEIITGRNSFAIPKDETTPWQATGGIQAYWEDELASKGQSKPLLNLDTIRLVKLAALVPLSDELLEDSIGLESWLRAKAPEKMIAKINTAIVRGNGVGKPLGILSSPSLVTVAAETSQPAATIYYANIVKMWSRLLASWRRNAVWLINQDIESQLYSMAFDPDATSKTPVYLPSGSIANSPYGVLMGRPVVPVEAASTLGTVGDIILVDMKQYWVLRKASGIRTDTSIHLFFDQDATAFRFVFRMNGQPAWKSAVTPENGNNTRSWAVALATRS